jgi:uncharacterized protein (DUF3820 family)
MFVNTNPKDRLDPDHLPQRLRDKSPVQIERELKAPFASTEVRWRAGATNAQKTRAMALAYIDARAVEDRLDQVFGPTSWWDDYREGPQGGVKCYLTAVYPDGWVITKTGLAPNTDIEAVKGGESDALKRAAVKFGIARYLYNLPDTWVRAEKRGRSVVLLEIPRLPRWALPNGSPSGSSAPKQGENGQAEGDPGEFVVPFGKYQGKKLSELSSEAVGWYAHSLEPRNKQAEALQRAARAYAASRENENGNGFHDSGQDLGEFVVPFGKNEGRKLSLLGADDLDWYAHKMEPINKQGQSLQRAARAFLAE